MQFRELAVSDALEVTPRIHSDDRGAFLEAFKAEALREAIGHPFHLRQVNTSISRRGTLRGIHFADVPPGQAKYVTVHAGSIIDYIIDVRVGSPTFGQWDSVALDAIERRAVYIGEGLGHAFVALEDDTVVSYLVTDQYAPQREHGINPLDLEIGLTLPFASADLLLSDKDVEAPTLQAALAAGLLPTAESVDAWRQSLAEGTR